MESDVIIIGGGPVGMGLAIDLAIQGMSSIVVETSRHSKNSKRAKSDTRVPASILGVGACPMRSVLHLLSHTTMPMAEWRVTELLYQIIFMTGLTDLKLQIITLRQMSGFLNMRLRQYCGSEQRAFDEITLLTGWSFDAFSQDETKVSATITQTHGDESQVLSSSFLVGCDGARSPVRSAAEITRTEDAHDQRMALLVFQSNELDERLARYGQKIIYNAINPGDEGVLAIPGPRRFRG